MTSESFEHRLRTAEPLDEQEVRSCATPELFLEQFKQHFTTGAAITARNVVYAWLARDKVPRLRGESEVLYVGKTTKSIAERHRRTAQDEWKGSNWQRHEYILQTFGPIRGVFWRTPTGTDPAGLEKRILREYFDAHLEGPPLNQIKF